MQIITHEVREETTEILIFTQQEVVALAEFSFSKCFIVGVCDFTKKFLRNNNLSTYMRNKVVVSDTLMSL